MNTVFMNSGNNKTPNPHRLLLNLSEKTNSRRRSDKYVAVSNRSISYAQKNIKSHAKTRG